MISPPHTTPAPDATQTPFSRVAPALRSALIVGVAGGFTLATVLTLTAAFHVPLGSWWRALVQTHGFLQLYGWAGLFALGVGAYVLPRLRGALLALSVVLGWILSLHLTSLVLRFACQPLAALTPSALPRAGLVASGVLEVAAVGLIYACALLTLRHGPPLTTRPAFGKVLPLFGIALLSLGVAAVVNLVNMARLGAVRIWHRRRARRRPERHAGAVRLPHPHCPGDVGANAANVRWTHVVPPEDPLDSDHALRQRSAALHL